MTTNNRYVFDTNVLVSALLFDTSTPAQAFFAARRIGTILISQDTIQEAQAVLQRKKFDRYVTVEERETFLYRFVSSSTLIEINEAIRVCQDPKDDKFLEVAINGNAACIITGDLDLLILHPFRTIAIVTPEAFLQEHIQADRSAD